MKENTKENIQAKNYIICFLIVVFVLSTIDYIGTIIESKDIFCIDILENCLIVFGYVITNIAVCFAIYETYKGQVDKNKSIIVSLICMIIRFVFDVYVYITEGNLLERTYNMDVFLILDILIVLFLIVYLIKKDSIHLSILTVLLIIYSLGEILGYETYSFTDWDEFFLMVSILAVIKGKCGLVKTDNNPKDKV